MGIGNALRGYYEYEKWKFTIVVIGIGLAVLVIGGLIFWFLFAAPQWNTFLDNAGFYFTNIGQGLLDSFANIGDWLINFWYILVEILLFFPFLALLIMGLVTRGRNRKLYFAIGLGGVAVSGIALMTTTALAFGGYIENPWFDYDDDGDVNFTHYYILWQVDGSITGGGWWGEARVDFADDSATRHSTTGTQPEVGWEYVSAPTWTVDNDNPTAVLRLFATIEYSDSSTWGEEQLFEVNLIAGQFDFTLRFDCPTGKTPAKLNIRIDELDYLGPIWIGRYDIFNEHYQF